MGRPAHLSPRPAPDLGRRRRRLARRRGLRDRDARRAGVDHQRALRQPPALHLSRLLPAGLQGQRQGQPADHPPARRDRARRRGARRRDGGARRGRRGQRAGHRRHLHQRRQEHFQPRRRRRRLRLRDRDPAAAAALDQPPLPATGSATATIRWAATSWSRARPRSPAGSPRTCGCTRRRPPEVSSEQFYETDEGRGFARGFSIQTLSPLPIGWAEHVQADGHWGAALREYMRDYNHWIDARAAVRAAAPARQPRHAGRRGRPVRDADGELLLLAVRQRQAPTSLTRRRRSQEIWEHAGAQDTLKIDRFAHLVGGARMGFTAEDSVVDAGHRVWGVAQPVHRRRQRAAHPGRRQPGAGDHGARRPVRASCWPSKRRSAPLRSGGPMRMKRA